MNDSKLRHQSLSVASDHSQSQARVLAGLLVCMEEASVCIALLACQWPCGCWLGDAACPLSPHSW